MNFFSSVFVFFLTFCSSIHKSDDIKYQTFTMIKPHLAQNKAKIEEIKKIIRAANFTINKEKEAVLTSDVFYKLYGLHKDKRFFSSLKNSFLNKKVYVMILEKNSQATVEDYRNLIGNTDPKKANSGTVRNLFGVDVQNNAVHASDSNERVKEEIAIFFND